MAYASKGSRGHRRNQACPHALSALQHSHSQPRHIEPRDNTTPRFLKPKPPLRTPLTALFWGDQVKKDRIGREMGITLKEHAKERGRCTEGDGKQGRHFSRAAPAMIRKDDGAHAWGDGDEQKLKLLSKVTVTRKNGWLS